MLDSRRRRTSSRRASRCVSRRKIREEAARQAEIRRQQELAEAAVKLATERRRWARVAVFGVIRALLLAAFGGYEAVIAIKETAVAHRAEVRAVSTLSRQFTERGDATTGMLAALPLMPDAMLPGARTHIAAAAMALLDAWSHHREILTLIGHTSLVLNASFSADGKRVVTASWDKTAGIWDLSGPVPVAPVAIELSGHKGGPVNTASFGAEGKLVVTSSSDKTAQLCDVKIGKPVGDRSQATPMLCLARRSAQTASGWSQRRMTEMQSSTRCRRTTNWWSSQPIPSRVAARWASARSLACRS